MPGNENNTNGEDRFSELFFSCMIAFAVSLLMISTSMITTIVKPRLYDGSINELGRYAMTFDAYEYISETSDSAVIGIGSSKMREAFDGILLGELDQGEYDFYNLAVAGDRPLVRMLEIEAIIEAEPQFILLEIGPNSFSFLNIPLPESTQSRMAQLVSIGDVNLDKYPNHILNESLKEILPNSAVERSEYLASFVPQAIEDTIEIELLNLEQPYPCSGAKADVRCVPLPNNSTYDEYLRYPIQFRDSLSSIKAGKSTISIEEFYGPRLDQYLNKTYHNPEGVLNQNQLAFEYMIDKFSSAGIEVVLVGLPYNPVLLNRLGPGQWDYYNSTIQMYSDFETVTVVDMMWDIDWSDEHFNDYTHMSREGEILFANKLMMNIGPLLNGD